MELIIFTVRICTIQSEYLCSRRRFFRISVHLFRLPEGAQRTTDAAAKPLRHTRIHVPFLKKRIRIPAQQSGTQMQQIRIFNRRIFAGSMNRTRPPYRQR